MEIRDNQEKHYLYVETTKEGIRQWEAAADQDKVNVEVGKMRVDGKWVPALRFEVDETVDGNQERYHEWKKEEWRQEDRYKQEKRCIICGKDGKSMRCPVRIKNPNYTGAPGENKTIPVECSQCPYEGQYQCHRGNVFFSTMDVSDGDGNTDAYEPESGNIHTGDDYLRLLQEFIKYVRVNYPKYEKYTEMIELLGMEIGLADTAKEMGKSYNTLYGWTRSLRPVFEEFMKEISFLDM